MARSSSLLQTTNLLCTSIERILSLGINRQRTTKSGFIMNIYLKDEKDYINYDYREEFMNYIGRKDGGTYIPSKSTGNDSFDSDLLIPIGYSKEIADLAVETKQKYREVFIKCYKDGKDQTTE